MLAGGRAAVGGTPNDLKQRHRGTLCYLECRDSGQPHVGAPAPLLNTRHRRRHTRQHSAATDVASSQGSVADSKAALLRAIQDTGRGSRVGKFMRGAIEELQVAVEAHQGARDLDWSLLGGMWNLQYTTALDVLPILEASSSLSTPLTPSPLQVGIIGQRFTSPVNGEGKVENVIELSVPYLLEEDKGLTVTVEASYEVRSGHRILLVFEAASVGGVRISPGLEAFIAPALLPRNSLQHLLLLAIKQASLRVPFRTAAQTVAGLGSLSSRQVAGGSYQLTYLDEDMLIGRATALGGVFIFSRAP
ncbi:hypothetical protein V8C86DRAFT_2934089 [Haematococcus lacustris]